MCITCMYLDNGNDYLKVYPRELLTTKEAIARIQIKARDTYRFNKVFPW